MPSMLLWYAVHDAFPLHCSEHVEHAARGCRAREGAQVVAHQAAGGQPRSIMGKPSVLFRKVVNTRDRR